MTGAGVSGVASGCSSTVADGVGVAYLITSYQLPNQVLRLARTQAQINADKGGPVGAQPGLAGRWGLDEGTGLIAANSVVGGPNGTLVPTPNANPMLPPQPAQWIAGVGPSNVMRCPSPVLSTTVPPKKGRLSTGREASRSFLS